MATVIDSAPTSIEVPRDDCVGVVIQAHNDDAQPVVLGTLQVVVGGQLVNIEATLPGSESSPVVYGDPVLSADLVAAGVTVESNGPGRWLVCGPQFDVSTHSH